MLKSGIMNLCSYFSNCCNTAILRYHSITYPEDNYYASPSIAVTPDEFEQQIQYLSKNFNIMSHDTVND